MLSAEVANLALVPQWLGFESTNTGSGSDLGSVLSKSPKLVGKKA